METEKPSQVQKRWGLNTQSPGSRQKRRQLSTQHIAEGEKSFEREEKDMKDTGSTGC